MRTVDFAAHNLIERLGLQDRAELRSPWKPIDTRLGGDKATERFDVWPSVHQIVDGHATLEPGDLVLSWGDFQLGFDYLAQSAQRYREVSLGTGRSLSGKDPLDWSYQYFLLQGILGRKGIGVASFGTTLFQNTMTDWANERYYSAISQYLDACEFALFRDPYSAWVAGQITGQPRERHWGIDAAILNEACDFDVLPSSSAWEQVPSGAVGVFLGRSTRSLSKWAFAKLAKQMSKRLGCSLWWLPWNYFSGSRLFRKRSRIVQKPLLDIEELPADADLFSGDIIRMLGRCQLVLTDTYHVAINAMALGIPAFCIYEPNPAAERNANMGYRHAMRDKRQLLYASTNQTDLLMTAEDVAVRRERERRVDHLVALLENTAAIDHWKRWLHSERSHIRNRLDGEISKLLGISEGSPASFN